MTAVIDAWGAAGQPEPNWSGRSRTPIPRPESRHGVCALTGMTGEVFPVTQKILSGMFTTWDRLPHRHVDPDGLALCEAAVWAFKDRALMSRPHGLVDGEWRELQPSALFRSLPDMRSFS